MRTIDIVLKDLNQILRDKKSLLFLLAMPIVFTLFMGLAFTSAATSPDPRLAIGWVNQDPSGEASQTLQKMLASSNAIRLVEIDPAALQDANQQVVSGKLAAAVVIPAGFSRGVLDGTAPQITVLADPTSGAGQSALQAVRGSATRMMSAAEIARLYGQQDAQEVQASFSLAATLWQDSAQNGPQVVIEKAQGQDQSSVDLGGNPYNQTSPGILVQFAVFSLVTSATILVQERKTRTLDRMITTSLSRFEIILGHLLTMFTLVFLQEVILVGFGQAVLKVNYLHEPLGTLLVMMGLAIMIASLGLLIGLVAKEDSQVILYSLIAMFVFSGLGGAWFPLEGTGKVFYAIGKLTPAAWAMTGFQNILLRGLDLTSVLLPTAALAAYAVAFFALALWKFSR